MIPRPIIAILLLSSLAGISSNNGDVGARQKVAAEKFFRGVYSGDTSVVGKYAADNIVISYPIFQTLFNSPVIEGHDSAVQFISRFSTKWKNPKITVHETITEGTAVVLIWSFQARDAFYDSSIKSNAGSEKKWGGITVYHFNQEGKINSEVGEESEPGPIGRLSSSNSSAG